MANLHKLFYRLPQGLSYILEVLFHGLLTRKQITSTENDAI